MVKYKIAHRGNIEGPKPSLENSPHYINEAIQRNYDVEIDLWIKDQFLFLGHDYPQYKIEEIFLEKIQKFSWIHCKNYEALQYMLSKKNYSFFWHQNDEFTLTSNNITWCYPSSTIYEDGINVMPEWNFDMNLLKNIHCLGICSDYIGLIK